MIDRCDLTVCRGGRLGTLRHRGGCRRRGDGARRHGLWRPDASLCRRHGRPRRGGGRVGRFEHGGRQRRGSHRETSIAVGSNALAIGATSLATAEGSTAIGAIAFALQVNATAIGYDAWATNDNSTAIGTGARTNADNQVTIGGPGSSVRIGDIAASTAAQVGPVQAVTVDANGTLGRQSVATTAALNEVSTKMISALAVTDSQFEQLSTRVGSLENRLDAMNT